MSRSASTFLAVLLLTAVFLSSSGHAAAAKPVMYVFGDIHYDPFYGTHMAVDIGGVCNTSTAPKYGAVNCDAPKALLESALQDIYSQAAQDGDGIFILTGDFVRHKMVDFAHGHHNSDESSRHDVEYDLIYNITDEIASLMAQYEQEYLGGRGGAANGKATKKKKLHTVVHPNVYSLVDGNEDCVPHYWFTNSLDYAQHIALKNLTKAMVENGIMSETEASQFGQCAFYSTSPPETNLVILGINTVLYSKQHVPNTTNITDPCGQLAWLGDQLQAAYLANKRVMILGHIIPDATKWIPEYLDAYRTLVMNYGDVISVQWFGHTHMFTFLTLSENKAPVLIDVPGITPRDGNMPSYLKVTFTDQSSDGPLNTSSWLIDQITERFFNITSNPNESLWQDGMSFPADFPAFSGSVTTNNLYNYGVALLSDKKDNTDWEQFQQFYFGGVVRTPLGKKHKAEVLCKAVTADIKDYDKCKADYEDGSV